MRAYFKDPQGNLRILETEMNNHKQLIEDTRLHMRVPEKSAILVSLPGGKQHENKFRKSI